VQQDPLVTRSDPEQLAGVVAGEPFDIPQQDHLTLARGKAIERCLESRQPAGGIEPVIRLLHPPVEWISPMALGVEPIRVHRVKRLDRGSRMFVRAG
jgi:hypothetical protein